MSTFTPRVGNNAAINSSTTEVDNQATTVQNSETNLSQVAERLGISEDALKEANPGLDLKKIKPGQELKLPSKATSETPASEVPANNSSYSKNAVHSRMAEHNIGSVARQLQIITQATQTAGGVQHNVLNDQLREAASKNDLKQMEDLIKKGADVNSKDQDGRTPLMHAAAAGSVKTMEALVKKYKANVNAQDNEGQTALMKASSANKNDAVSTLLDLKANVGARDKNGATALIYAARKGNREIADTLIEKGNADVNNQDKNGRTALMEAIEKGGNNELIRDLSGLSKTDVQDSKGNTALMLLIRRQQVVGSSTADQDALRRLIMGSKNLNLQDDNGRTALMDAGKMFDPDTVKALMDAGADVNLQDKDGKTLLMELGSNRLGANAREFAHIDSIIAASYLDLKDNFGRTALFEYAASGDDNMVKKLHLAGADLNLADKTGRTPLMEAAQKGHKWVVKALLDTDWQNEPHLTVQNPTRKADPNKIDDTNTNALGYVLEELRQDQINQRHGKPPMDPVLRENYEVIIDTLRKEMEASRR